MTRRKKSESRTLEEAIEDERARLMQAHSILSCVALAMENDDGGNQPGPYYPGLIEMARDLINESIQRLDDLDYGSIMAKR